MLSFSERGFRNSPLFEHISIRQSALHMIFVLSWEHILNIVRVFPFTFCLEGRILPCNLFQHYFDAISDLRSSPKPITTNCLSRFVFSGSAFKTNGFGVALAMLHGFGRKKRNKTSAYPKCSKCLTSNREFNGARKEFPRATSQPKSLSLDSSQPELFSLSSYQPNLLSLDTTQPRSFGALVKLVEICFYLNIYAAQKFR